MSSSIEAWHGIDQAAEDEAAEAVRQQAEAEADAEHWAGYFATQAVMQ